MAMYRKLGMVSSHRKAVLRNLATDILKHGRVTTTETRAKEARRMVEKMITLGKKGDLAARRQAAEMIRFETDDKGNYALQKLFNEIKGLKCKIIIYHL